MAKRFVVQSIKLMRDGKAFRPAVGKVEEFTKDEIDSIVKANPAALRMPNDESAAESLPQERKAPRDPSDPTQQGEGDGKDLKSSEDTGVKASGTAGGENADGVATGGKATQTVAARGKAAKADKDNEDEI